MDPSDRVKATHEGVFEMGQLLLHHYDVIVQMKHHQRQLSMCGFSTSATV